MLRKIEDIKDFILEKYDDVKESFKIKKIKAPYILNYKNPEFNKDYHIIVNLKKEILETKEETIKEIKINETIIPLKETEFKIRKIRRSKIKELKEFCERNKEYSETDFEMIRRILKS